MSRSYGDAAPAIAAIDRKIAPHAHLLEFGTVHMTARPFFRRTIDATAGRVGQMLEDGIKKMIERAL